MIDDHTLFREGLEGLLRRRGVEVLSFSNGQEGLAAAESTAIDIVMVDLRMPDMNGVEVLKKVRSFDTELPVLILTTSDNAEDLKACLRHGANGYLLKDMEPDELVVALKKIVNGETVVAPELANTLASIIQDRGKNNMDKEESVFSVLSPREMEILSHLTEGQSNKVIARHLGITDGTVKLHVKSILKKLGLHSRVEAAVLATNMGIFKNGSSN